MYHISVLSSPVTRFQALALMPRRQIFHPAAVTGDSLTALLLRRRRVLAGGGARPGRRHKAMAITAKTAGIVLGLICVAGQTGTSSGNLPLVRLVTNLTSRLRMSACSVQSIRFDIMT